MRLGRAVGERSALMKMPQKGINDDPSRPTTSPLRGPDNIPRSGLMPRLAPKLLVRASRENYLLPLLLQSCRDLRSARRELTWLEEHVQGVQHIEPGKLDAYLYQLCLKRSWGVPLQYLLGSEYFGDLEIACRPGVLIPRWAARRTRARWSGFSLTCLLQDRKPHLWCRISLVA